MVRAAQHVDTGKHRPRPIRRRGSLSRRELRARFLSAARRHEHAGHAVCHYGWLVFRRPRTRRRGHLVSTPTETALEYTVINTDVRPSPKYSAHAAWEAALQETRRNNTNPLADHG